jgi:hypothetical protein
VARLSGSDYRGILELVHAAGEVEGSDPFPEQVLARLRELVPCDTVSYGDFDCDGHVWRTGVRYSGEPRAPVTPATHEAHGRLAYQYPYRPWSPEARRPLRWSDLFSRREWHALDLYWEVVRPLEGEYELELWLATPDGMFCVPPLQLTEALLPLGSVELEPEKAVDWPATAPGALNAAVGVA